MWSDSSGFSQVLRITTLQKKKKLVHEIEFIAVFQCSEIIKIKKLQQLKQPLAATFGEGWELLWEAQLHQHPAFST